MAHCGFEGTAVNETFDHPLKALQVSLFGPKLTGPMAPELPQVYAEGSGPLMASAPSESLGTSN
jgi:hypothetical protein